MSPVSNTPVVVRAQDLTDSDLLDLYQGPTSGPWLRVNFVASVDGAIATGGTSTALTNPLDQQVLKLLRELSDVVLVGASTIRAEDYIGIRIPEASQQRRAAVGMTATPPIAVVSGRAAIDPRSRLLTNTRVPPIILTTAAAPSSAKRDLETAGATVIEIGDDRIESSAILDALTARGLTRVVCEGGPTLTGQLAADGILQELCVTTAPVVLAGLAARITNTTRSAFLRMTCQHIILDTDGSQLARWTRQEI